uniref:Uncharacterized protein n=1 Tax=Equus asinus asinus TaxID=83772 RepID=A0A8C4LU31_EQUAS
MSVSGLIPPRPLGSISGILQVASLLGLVLLLLKAAQLYLCRQWLLKASQEFPCPPSHWLYRHSREVGRDKELQQMMKRVEKFLCISPRCLWGSEAILGRSGESKTHPLGQLFPLGSTPLTFHYNILKPYVALMANTERVNVLFPPQDKWEELISQDLLLEIFGHVSLMTLDIIMKCAFSHQGSRQGHDNPSAVGSYFLPIGVDLPEGNVFYQNDIINRLTPAGCWNHWTCQLAQNTDCVIKLRKAHLQKEGELEKVRRKKSHLDFLDIPLTARMENGSSLSDADLRAEVDKFMFKGHDTTVSGISWILYALATYPKHQQRCWEEILSLLGDSASIRWGCLDQLSNTTMFIKEALELNHPLTHLPLGLNPSPATS